MLYHHQDLENPRFLEPESELLQEVFYLMYEISTDGLRPGVQKQHIILDFAESQTVYVVRSSIELSGFFRQ